MSPIKTLVEKFPTLVMVPQARECFLLQWYEEYEGNQVILASTEVNAVSMFKRTFQKHSGVEPVKFFRAKFVSPPLDLQVADAQQAYDNMVTNFKSYLSWAAKDLPKGHGFPKCKYHDPELKSRHIGCTVKDCYGGVIVDEVRFLELCWAEHDRTTSEALSKRNKKTQYPMPSQAPEPTLGPVYVAMANYGHHCSGLTLNEIGSTDYRGFGSTEYLFFFQGEELSGPKEITDFIEADKKAEKEREAQAAKAFKDRKAKQDVEAQAVAVLLFGLKP